MFSFGFYNSQNGDRLYNATHFSKIFDGVIQDGVFGAAPAPLNSKFSVTPTDPASLSANLNPGKAWLAHTWNTLDAATILTFNQVGAQYKRTDAVCIEVNNNYTQDGRIERTNKIVIVEGGTVNVDNTDNSPPTLLQVWNSSKTERRIWQYPLAYVTIYGKDKVINGVNVVANQISAACIESRIGLTGQSEVSKYVSWIPLVTGATMDADLNTYFPNYNQLLEQYLGEKQAQFNSWFNDMINTIELSPEGEAALAQLNIKIDDKIIYGTTEPGEDLDPGQVYFQIEE